eukprot:s1438_g4.t1
MKCNIDSLRISYEGIAMKPCDFIAEFPKQTFAASFRTCLPGYVACAPAESQVAEVGMIPAHSGCIRFVTRHPAKKITRTCCVPKGSSFSAVTRALLPDISASVSWTIHEGGVPVEPEKIVTENSSFVVEWDCFKPLAPTPISASSFALPVDSTQIQLRHIKSPQRWVKSPFKVKAQVLQLPEEAWLADIAASFVSHAQLDVNLTCHVGGKLVDPFLKVHEVPVEEVICFKIAPLLGGAKQKVQDAMKVRVARVLEKHGVAKDASVDRAASFLLKADCGTLAKEEGSDDDDFWKAIKNEANRVHFRLVFRNEMQQAKRDNRQKPPAKPVKKAKQMPSHEGFVANASNVVIDMKHFWDGEVNAEKIEQSRFGPDQKGLAVMSLDEANRHACGPSMSVDALAILVVGKKFDATDSPFAMPAHSVRGEPVVIMAALRQFGDRDVSFKAAVPVSEVGKSASTVIELHIFRSEVGAWRECSVPLHYLGVHISAVRGSNLIATWAMKTWSDSRCPAPFKEAQYWHGYIRVHDDILDQVLSRSGLAGIYVSPKDSNRRHDERFSVLALPDCNLSDAQKKASVTEKALGVVKLRDQLGIRCRREHAAALRAVLLPESAYVAAEGINGDETMWVLIPSEVGRDGLQAAFQQSGWEAKPIRAQGHDRWIVAARNEPPTKHFCINGSFVLVEPIKRQRDGPSISISAKQVEVDTVISAAPNGVQVATSTRIQEVKAEISDQMEQRLQQANAKIEHLAQTLEQIQIAQQSKEVETKNELAQMRQEQVFAKQKISEVEASVVQSSQTVIQTMQAMMTQMQSNLEASMKQMIAKDSHAEEAKRPRSDQGSRVDPFANKA